MITLDQYVGIHAKSKDWTAQRKLNAIELLKRSNALVLAAQADGVMFKINPKTDSLISGETFGGFRPQSCPIGAPNSNHKEGKGVDVWDFDGSIDAWCNSPRGLLACEKCGIWLEDQGHTPGWVHMQSIPPKSGKRVFLP